MQKKLRSYAARFYSINNTTHKMIA